MIPDDSSSCVMNFGAPGVKSAGSNVATSVSASLPMSYFQIRARYAWFPGSSCNNTLPRVSTVML